MKYRVKIITNGNGDKKYIPQVKTFIIWKTLGRYTDPFIWQPYIESTFTSAYGRLSEYNKEIRAKKNVKKEFKPVAL